MTHNQLEFYALIATLVAIVTLTVVGAVASINGHNAEALGISAAVTGLIGMARGPRSSSATVQQGETP